MLTVCSPPSWLLGPSFTRSSTELAELAGAVDAIFAILLEEALAERIRHKGMKSSSEPLFQTDLLSILGKQVWIWKDSNISQLISKRPVGQAVRQVPFFKYLPFLWCAALTSESMWKHLHCSDFEDQREQDTSMRYICSDLLQWSCSQNNREAQSLLRWQTTLRALSSLHLERASPNSQRLLKESFAEPALTKRLTNRALLFLQTFLAISNALFTTATNPKMW